MGSCPGLSSCCTFGLYNQLAGSYAPATELELIMFRPLPLRGIVRNLITQVDGGILAAYITVFDLRRGKSKRFTPFIIFSLVYMSISSNLVTLDTLSTWYDSVHMHTCSPFLRNPS